MIGAIYIIVSNPSYIMSDHYRRDNVLFLLRTPAFKIIHYFCCSFIIENGVLKLDLLKKNKLQGANYRRVNTLL